MALGATVRRLREAKGWTLDTLSEMSDVDVGTISALENRDSKRSQYVNRLARALGVSVDELQGDTSPSNDSEPSDVNERPVEVTEVELSSSKIPVISWVSAGAWNEAFDPYAPGAAEDWVSVPGQHSRGAIALRVRGDSMEPRFPDGCVIIVETHRRPKSGQFVVVRNNDWNEATFKQYIVDGGVKLLKPLNDRYPVVMVSPGTVMVGVIVRKFIDEAV